MIYKFVKWDIPELDTFRNETVYKLHKALENGKTITQEDKDYLYRGFRSSMSGGPVFKLHGYAFDFSKWTHLFYLEQYGSVYKRYAFNKTSIRNEECGTITRIVLVK